MRHIIPSWWAERHTRTGQPITDAKQISENTIGILAMLAAMAGLIINDAFVKLVSSDVPLGQIIFVRGLIATSVIALVAWRLGEFGRGRELMRGAVLLRLIGEIGATVCYLFALLHLPLSIIVSILQAVPLLLTIVAAVYLREDIDWRRWLAAIIGFGGVLLITKPFSGGLDFWVGLAVATLFWICVRDVATRNIPKHIPTNMLTLATAGAVTVLGIAIGLVVDAPWVIMTSRQWTYVTLASLVLLAAYGFIIIAMRSGDMSVVTPFRYSIVVWALLLGWAIWGEVPDGLSILGIAIIIAAGLYIFYREHLKAASPNMRL